MKYEEKKKVVKTFRNAYDNCVSHEAKLEWLLDNAATPDLEKKFRLWKEKRETLRQVLAHAFYVCGETLYGTRNSLDTCLQVILPTQWVRERLEDAERVLLESN